MTIPDSEFIIHYLHEEFRVTLDDPLSDQEKAQAYLLGKSLDENLYWCLVYSRWAKEDTWQTVKHALFGSLPFPLRHIVRQGVLSTLKKQGISKHSEQDIHHVADRSFQALSHILGEKAYFFGTSPCTFDATAFAFLAEFILVSLENEMNTLARGYPNLVRYCEAISTKYY